METKVYNQEGKEAGKISLPASVFDVKWNADLVHQVVVSMQSNARSGTAHTKNRGEVRGGGKKPWQQKGTGRARHGSRRSPLWRGGGITFGPRKERNYRKKINKKMRAKALAAVLSEKLRRGELLFLESLSVKGAKTKAAAAALTALSKVSGMKTFNTKKHNNVFVAVPKRELSVVKGFRNLPNAELEEVRNLNALDVSTHRYIVLVDPKESVAFLEGKLGAAK